MTSQPADGSTASAEVPVAPAPVQAEVPVEAPVEAEAPVEPETAAVSPVPYRIRRTRVGGVWVAAALFAVVLLLLLIFILENGKRIPVSFFGATGHPPLGVALLLAAVLGILLVVIPGTGRILQLRISARRHRRHQDIGV